MLKFVDNKGKGGGLVGQPQLVKAGEEGGRGGKKGEKGKRGRGEGAR